MIPCTFKLKKLQKTKVHKNDLEPVDHEEQGYYLQTISTKTNMGSTALLGVVCDISGRLYHVPLAAVRINVGAREAMDDTEVDDG